VTRPLVELSVLLPEPPGDRTACAIRATDRERESRNEQAARNGASSRELRAAGPVTRPGRAEPPCGLRIAPCSRSRSPLPRSPLGRPRAPQTLAPGRLPAGCERGRPIRESSGRFGRYVGISNFHRVGMEGASPFGNPTDASTAGRSPRSVVRKSSIFVIPRRRRRLGLVKVLRHLEIPKTFGFRATARPGNERAGGLQTVCPVGRVATDK
jgi:hypothetical protein